MEESFMYPDHRGGWDTRSADSWTDHLSDISPDISTGILSDVLRPPDWYFYWYFGWYPDIFGWYSGWYTDWYFDTLLRSQPNDSADILSYISVNVFDISADILADISVILQLISCLISHWQLNWWVSNIAVDTSSDVLLTSDWYFSG